jgi:hypothetical protein
MRNSRYDNALNLNALIISSLQETKSKLFHFIQVKETKGWGLTYLFYYLPLLGCRVISIVNTELIALCIKSYMDIWRRNSGGYRKFYALLYLMWSSRNYKAERTVENTGNISTLCY